MYALMEKVFVEKVNVRKEAISKLINQHNNGKEDREDHED